MNRLAATCGLPEEMPCCRRVIGCPGPSQRIKLDRLNVYCVEMMDLEDQRRERCTGLSTAMPGHPMAWSIRSRSASATRRERLMPALLA